MKRKEFRYRFMEGLSPLYDEHEVSAMLRWYVQDRLGISFHIFILDIEEEMPIGIDYLSDLQRLASGEPLQHITGFTEFCGFRFQTDGRALIPRPETEELVSAVATDWQERATVSILDIGTGTGAIAVSLAHLLPHAAVDALDVSRDALDLAQLNAAANQVPVRFFQQDILKTSALPREYDVIVSNPPYIPESARATLHRNVTDFEPSLALFVPDDSPLIFYEKIAVLAISSLKNEGKLYFETYEDFHPQLKKLLETIGFISVECRRDFFGRQRFVVAVRP
ncbi:MAG: peptide chain release factor N(5)-glutamine methyltransferase [Bacteroidales bacterium]|nr:peptide chain release factor N(5)-glutamine methyltransferase [Bacteroidales bacterium]